MDKPYPSEIKPLAKMSKALYAARDLRAGTALTAADSASKSPGDKGLPPYYLDQLIGGKLTRDLREDDLRSLESLA